MAGVHFRITGACYINSPDKEEVLFAIRPFNNRQIVIKEISVTSTDQEMNGGSVFIKACRFEDIDFEQSGFELSQVVPDNPNLNIAIQVSLFKNNGDVALNPEVTDVLDNKIINANCGEFLWIALRDEDKIPIFGGNANSINPTVFGIKAKTDINASGVDIMYSIRCEY
jgi:hypothetical protein